MKSARALVRILPLVLIASCGGAPAEPDGSVDAGSIADASTLDARVPADAGRDAGEGADAGADAGPPADTLTIERWGERLYGRVIAMSRIDRELWIGTSAVIDPSLGERAPVRSALARLDLDSGALRVFEDELPRVTDELGHRGPTPTSSVVAVGERRLVASRAGLLVVEGDTVTLRPILIDTESAIPTHLTRDASSGAVWASTDRGLVELDPATLAAGAIVGVGDLGGSPGPLAIDPATSAIYVAVHPDSAPPFVARVHGGDITRLMPGQDGAPSGLVGDVVWSSTYGGAFIALASWEPGEGGVILWDGHDVRTIADEARLSEAAHGEVKPFGASALAYDESAGVLVVGGRIRVTPPLGILQGGGLAWIDVADPDGPLRIAGMSSATSDLRGDAVTAAAYDPIDGRTYVGLQQPCSETRMGNVGIHAISFQGGKPRFELPILSSVRDMQRIDGELWVGISDDQAGVSCAGVEVQVGFGRVDGSRAALAPVVKGWAATRSSTNAFEIRRADQRVAVGRGVELYVGGDESGLLLSPAIDLGVSLQPEDVAWEDDRTFWITSQSTHQPGDPPHLADVGPRGAVRVVLDEAGEVSSRTHYVRRARDPMPDLVEGLPSAEVYDVLFDESGAVHLVCGTERLQATYDRTPRDVFFLEGQLRRGGVVRIEEDGSITMIAGPGDAPDGRAAAFAPDGTLYILDAERGLVRQMASGFEVVALAGVPAGSEPHALWVGEGGDLVAGFSTGAFVRLGGEERFIDDVGFVWSVEASRDVVLLGTDRGLVRVIPAGAADAGEPAPAAGEAPPFVTIDPPLPPADAGVPDADAGVDGGACLPEGAVCHSDPTGCCPGLVCSSFGFVKNCAVP